MKPTAPSRGPAKSYPPDSFMGKLRRRGIISTLAAFLGSGWFVYEIVHFILVEHYGLPDRLKDITIVSILAAMLCILAWRWFRGKDRTKGPKWEIVLIPAIIVIAAAVDVNYLLHLNAHGRDSSVESPMEIAWKNSIAVLPFVNISADEEQDYFCDGLTEEMINRLSQVPGLKVTARTSAFVFKGETRDIREVGRRLGVKNVLEGSVRKDGPRLRITAQLISAADGFHLWSEAYDRDLDKVFKIQDEIALSVASALKLTLLGERGPPSRTRNLQAYDEYLMGQSFYRNPTMENLDSAVAHYGRAVALDPEYANAWASLAGAQAMQAGFGYVPSETGFKNAYSSLDRALALDDRLAFAYTIQGWIRMSYDWDWAGADASYSKAMSLEPGRGLVGAAQLALALGRFDRAVSLASSAAELDSLSATAQMNLAFALFCSGRLEEAREAFGKVIGLSPTRSNAHSLLAHVYLMQGLREEALMEVEKEAQASNRLPAQAMVYHSLGRSREAYDTLARVIEDYSEGNAYQVAQIFAHFGDVIQAFEWLEIAHRQRDGGLFLMKADPFFKSLRSDPRFSAFLKKMGFPS